MDKEEEAQTWAASEAGGGGQASTLPFLSKGPLILNVPSPYPKVKFSGEKRDIPQEIMSASGTLQ